MNDIVCPPYYSCTFTPQHVHYVVRSVGPWWHGGGGLAVTLVAILAMAATLIWIATAIANHAREAGRINRAAKDKQLERQHELALEEQRTMQADMAKGDIEFLKLLRKGPDYNR